MEKVNARSMNSYHREILEDINKELLEAIDITAVDFIKVNDMLKSYYHSSTAENNSVHLAIEAKIQFIVTNLQHHDIFRQRVEHLVLVHQKLMTDEWQLDFVEPVFHLHVFQAMTIELDLLKAISSVSDTLREVNTEYPQMREHCCIEKCFAHTNRIKEIIKRTVWVLQTAGGNLKHLPISPVRVNQLTRIYSLYTMESERVVLDWFINSIPSGSPEELLLHYHQEIERLNTSEELF